MFGPHDVLLAYCASVGRTRAPRNMRNINHKITAPHHKALMMTAAAAAVVAGVDVRCTSKERDRDRDIT